MSVETQMLETRIAPAKRKFGQNKSGKGKKRVKMFSGTDNKVKIDGKMKKLFRKRARDYNSDNDDDDDDDGEEEEDDDQPAIEVINQTPLDNEEVSDGNSSGEDEDDGPDEKEALEDEGDEIQPGITRFTDGCRAFKMAFTNIIKKSVSDNTLGPVLSGHTKLVAEKLAEESEWKVKGEAKKEKHLVREKGHVKPANFLDSHEKFLISVATKGANQLPSVVSNVGASVVKLFNAVNKVQNAQKGLNPSRSKDAKVLGKRRKQAFLAELHKKPSQAAGTKGNKSTGAAEDDGPAWAPLRDSYMLTNSKLKNWDKMADTTTVDDTRVMQSDSSSDED